MRRRSPGDEDGAHQGIVSVKCFYKMSFCRISAARFHLSDRRVQESGPVCTERRCRSLDFVSVSPRKKPALSGVDQDVDSRTEHRSVLGVASAS